jgi:arsenate reductase
MPGRPIQIEVLTFRGCPHADETVSLVQRLAARLSPQADVRRIEVETPERASEIGFLGSPSVRVGGRDLEGRTGEGALACRTYDGAGVPPEWLVEAAIARGLEPGGVLFLCVANSARSQMAEGIARSVVPDGVTVWSAGSRPAAVRQEAITVLREIGIDISRQRSKGVTEIPAAGVDLVVTLCAEEVCPVFLGKAVRLHWGLPDPAAIEGSEEERRAAYRRVRDELRRRIAALLAG